MKTLRVISLSLFFVLPFVSSNSASAQTKNDGFQAFYTKLRSAINSQNKTALKNLMSSSFIWYQDGEVSRNEAIQNIGEMFTWKKFWQSAKKATAKNATRCKSPYCENRAGYHISGGSSSLFVEMYFAKSVSGQWYWTGLLGD